MVTFLISDLHLHASRPSITQRFLDFLEGEGASADALYILGDFFEVWLGMDASNSHDQSIITALSKYSAKIPVYFMRGNRDFLIDEKFSEMSGSQILSDPIIVQLYNHPPILLTHGDSLCTLDIAYQRFRRVVRQPFIQRLFLSFPVIWRRKIAGRLRNHDRDHVIDPKYDAVQETVESWMQQYSTYFMFHGHTHQPGIHEFSYQGRSCKRMVMGEWTERKSIILKVSPDNIVLWDLANSKLF